MLDVRCQASLGKGASFHDSRPQRRIDWHERGNHARDQPYTPLLSDISSLDTSLRLANRNICYTNTASTVHPVSRLQNPGEERIGFSPYPPSFRLCKVQNLHPTHFARYPSPCFPSRPRSGAPSTLHSIMQLWTRPLDRPLPNLVILCVAWKFFLLLIAVLSPGPGYDTSASLFSPSAAECTQLPPAIQYILSKLTRWDAIYFVKIADRGYVFEQEWAFGWGFTRLISLCAAGERFLWSQRRS
jgi:hypothetical protein